MKTVRYFVDACILVFVSSIAMMAFSLLMNIAAVLDGHMANFTMFGYGLWMIAISGGILAILIGFSSIVLRRSPIKLTKALINNLKVDLDKLYDEIAKD